jgi:3-isopropylmalate/(R)-2-methylmalate dehydratase small subunit
VEPFTRFAGVAAPLDRPNVDTDQIIPKQFLKRIERSGYGPFLFYDWRYQGAWALEDYGVRAVIAPSFSDIFRSNALKIGLLPVQLPEEVVARWMDLAREEPGLEATVDLERGYVEFNGERRAIELDEDARERLLGGLDDIALSLRLADAITGFEAQRSARLPTTAGLGG